MADKKKRKKKGKRQRVETMPDAPVAKRERPKAEEAERDVDASAGTRDEGEEAPRPSDVSHSLPPTKKSTLPPELAHDDREIAATTIARLAFIVCALTALVMLGSWYLDEDLASSERMTHTAPLPMATSLPTAPPEPRLQRTPRLGLAAFKAQEKKELDSYGWVDEREGIVQIPIERAMELTVQRGLPARERPEDVGPKVSQPTDASLEPGGQR